MSTQHSPKSRMMSFKYYFISLPEQALDAILKKCVTKDLDSQVKMWDGSYLIKVEGKTPPVLKNYTAYTPETVKAEKIKRDKGRPEL